MEVVRAEKDGGRGKERMEGKKEGEKRGMSHWERGQRSETEAV